MSRWLILIILLLIGTCNGSPSLEAHISQRGVKGQFFFTPTDSGTKIQIELTVSSSMSGEYSWGIYPHPIDYRQSDYCHSRILGRKPEINFDDSLGKLNLPLESGSTSFDVPENLTETLWGKSLVLEGPDRSRICSSLILTSNDLLTAEARFNKIVGGSVWFSSIGSSIKIYSNLFHLKNSAKSSSHSWKLFITDLFESQSANQRDSCDFLQILYDPNGISGENCSSDIPENCKQGDLTSKFGKVKVGRSESMFTKILYTDNNLVFPDFNGQRSLYLVLYDDEYPDSFLTCAKVNRIKLKTASASFNDLGVKGEIKFEQASPFQPLSVRINFDGLNSSSDSFHIHEFPVPLKSEKEFNPCGLTGGHYNPTNVDPSSSPPKGEGTVDKYEVGDLSGKYGGLGGLNSYSNYVWDSSLTLFGPRSIIGRSVVLHETPVQRRWICSDIILTSAKSIIRASVTFTYPVAGIISFEQDSSDYTSDTTIYVNGLVYSDGTKNSTSDHPWHVHLHTPGKDYFNWTGRCLSAGGHFNPYGIEVDSSIYNKCTNQNDPFICELGDLANKHGSLSVAGRVANRESTVRLFTDTNLPLSGRYSVLGKSITIHDNNAPEHRGNRMACASIRRKYRHKAVARNWFSNEMKSTISGRLEFIQESSTSISRSLIDLKGLDALASGYHVHMIPIQSHLEFPCTGDAIGGHFNPFEVDASKGPTPSSGTSDQYELGDLSGKYGLLDDLEETQMIYNDTNLPLFGPNSIVGRSIVIHKKIKGKRWACSTIGWGFDPDEAREIRAIASFHHPNGFAWGYVRFSQVVYADGSSTPTVMEVRLKYPGKTNKAMTHNHDWSIYVNPVGHDAAVKFASARCTAAGYRWNPTLIQLADPENHGFYSEECIQNYPLRCQVGDLSGKNGKITIGGNAYILHDENLNLNTGDWFTSAIGKSLVIHESDGRTDRMACANIVNDKDIIKYATIRTKTRFNLQGFMEEVRAIMGVPEWFLHTDSRETKYVHNDKCIQLKLHFTGPHASKLERDFTKLLRTSKLHTPSIAIPGYNPDPLRKTKLDYTECRNGIDSANRHRYSGSSRKTVSSSLFGLVSIIAFSQLLSLLF